MLRVLAIPVRGYVGLPRLTLNLDHLECREGVDTCRRFSLLGVQTGHGDFGAIWGSDVLASVVVGYGRRGTGHTSPRDTTLEGKFLSGLGAEETETHKTRHTAVHRVRASEHCKKMCLSHSNPWSSGESTQDGLSLQTHHGEVCRPVCASSRAGERRRPSVMAADTRGLSHPRRQPQPYGHTSTYDHRIGQSIFWGYPLALTESLPPRLAPSQMGNGSFLCPLVSYL